jgi:histidyl-tRNA synthetase
MGENARKKAFAVVADLRDQGFRADMDHCGRSMKAQFKFADKCGAPYVAVIGEDELAKGVAKMRDMRSSTEEEVQFSDLKLWIKQEKING